MAPALKMYWWYNAAIAAPMNGPTQKIHCTYMKLINLDISWWGIRSNARTKLIRNISAEPIYISFIAGKGPISSQSDTLYKLMKWNYLVIPCLVFVVDDGGPETPSRVDARSGDGDGSKVNHEHRESNGKWSQHLY